MKIFLSWSGEVSHKVALILREWLPNILQVAEPYVSSEDIDKGNRWSTDIAKELESSSYGILCVTSENINAPWLNFEAGALSKTIEKSRVSPFLFALKRSDIKSGPILQFQSTISEKGDIRKLVESINQACEPNNLEETRLAKAFEIWWPHLERSLNELSSVAHGSANLVEETSISKEEEILEEILGLVRQQNRVINDPHTLFPLEYFSSMIGRPDPIEGHPAFNDLAGKWIALREQAKRAREKSEVPDAIYRSIDRLEEPLMFILERYGRASFRNRKLGRLLSNESGDAS